MYKMLKTVWYIKLFLCFYSMNLYSIRRNISFDLKEDLLDFYKPGSDIKNKRLPQKIKPVVAVIPKVCFYRN